MYLNLNLLAVMNTLCGPQPISENYSHIPWTMAKKSFRQFNFFADAENKIQHLAVPVKVAFLIHPLPTS